MPSAPKYLGAEGRAMAAIAWECDGELLQLASVARWLIIFAVR